jgi:magnesium transporter
VHELALKSLRGGPERPRVEEYPDHLYLSLFFAREAGSRSALQDLRIFMGPQWLLSLADFTEEEYAELRGLVERNVFARSRGQGHLLYVIAGWAVETLDPVVDRIDERLDDLEDVVVLNPHGEVMQQLFGVKREIAELRRQVLPLRDVMQHLSSRGMAFVEPEAEVYFRDVHDDVLRVIEDLDSHREILASALDIYESGISNRLNEVMKRLTLVATLFMPITFITGFFGMNFEMLPFGSSLWFAVMLAALIASVFSMLFIYGRGDHR